MAITDAQTEGVITEAIGPHEILLAGTVIKGDLVGNATGWKRALATVSTAIQAKLVAGKSGVSGETITCYLAAKVSGRYSGGAGIGTQVYSAEGTSNGKVTETAPSTTGDCNKLCGIELSATELWLFPGLVTDSLAP